MLVVCLQLAHELYTRVYSVRLELEEVETTADRSVARFAGEIHKFCEGASNLHRRGHVSTILLLYLPFTSKSLWSRAQFCRARDMPDTRTSSAIWLTTDVWFGSRMSWGSCS
jgi:hypothetical protein